MSAERDAPVRTVLGLASLCPCVLCGRVPADGAALFVPNRSSEHRVIYGLCSRCARRCDWAQAAEAVLYAERAA